jgi:hypothetical protein
MEEKYCAFLRAESLDAGLRTGVQQACDEFLSQLPLGTQTETVEGMTLLVFDSPGPLLDGLSKLGALLHQKAAGNLGWSQMAVGIDRGHVFHLADRGGLKHFTGSCLRIAKRLSQACPTGKLRFTPVTYKALQHHRSPLAKTLTPLSDSSRRMDQDLGLVELEISWDQLLNFAGGVDTVLSKLCPPVSKEAKDAIIKKLATRIGPVAAPLVEQALQQVKPHELAEHLAENITNATDRKAFKQEASELLKQSTGVRPVRSEKLDQLQKLLAGYVGPVSQLLLKEAAPRTGQTLIEFLCNHFPDSQKADNFMHEAMRLMRDDRPGL